MTSSPVKLMTTLFGCLFLIFCQQRGEERSSGPDMEFDQMLHDFGEIDHGAKAEYTYEFENRGNDTLRIVRIQKTCGCQSAKATREVIPPGERGGIWVAFNSKGLVGDVTRRVYIHSNDPAEGRVALEMSGTVLVDFLVRPKTLNFRQIPVGRSKSMKAYIIPQKMERLEIGSIEASAEYITVARSDYVEEGKKGAELEVTIGPDAPPRRIVERVKISTSSQKQPLIEMHVYATVSEKIIIDPKILQVQLGSGESREYQISVFKGSRKDFRIDRVEDDLEAIETEISLLKEQADMQDYQIQVRANPTASPGPLKGSLTLYTNDTKESIIQMPVAGRILSAKK